MRTLATAPHRGVLHPELGPNVRHLTKDRVIFYFQVVEDIETVRILAIFFGGQDHQTHIRKRLENDPLQ